MKFRNLYTHRDCGRHKLWHALSMIIPDAENLKNSQFLLFLVRLHSDVRTRKNASELALQALRNYVTKRQK